jgi:hypothetical protein
MIKLPDDVIKLMDEVRKECPSKYCGVNYDEWDNLEQYKQHLERILQEHKNHK